MAILGSASVTGWLLSLIGARGVRWNNLLDAAFLISLGAIFTTQLIQGLNVITHPGDPGAVHTIAVLLIACFLAGIARSWELIGGPPPIEAGHTALSLMPDKNGAAAAAESRRAPAPGNGTGSDPSGHER